MNDSLDRRRGVGIIHTAGPVWTGGDAGEDDDLASCHASALALAVEHDLRSIAFPAISCGVYGFPVERASGIAVRTIRATLRESTAVERVILVAFGDELRGVPERAVVEHG